MSDKAPTSKVAAAGVVGAPLALVLVWLAGQFGVDMPAEVGGAFGALVASAVAYVKRDA